MHVGRRTVQLLDVQGTAARLQHPRPTRRARRRTCGGRAGRPRARTRVTGQVEDGQTDGGRRAVLLHLLVAVLHLASLVGLGQRSTLRRYDMSLPQASFTSRELN